MVVAPVGTPRTWR